MKLHPNVGNANVDELVFMLEDILECMPRP